MKKLFLLTISCLSLFFFTPAAARNMQAAIYKGLEPEISTLNDTIRILGSPISKRANDKFIICKYRVAEVIIEKKTGKIGAIIILDQTFKDANGFMIGDPFEKIRNILNYEGKENIIYDKKKNIIYIFNPNNFLEEIVYGVLSK